jgi:hypothetical protein
MNNVLSFFGANEFSHTGDGPKKHGGANDTKDFRGEGGKEEGNVPKSS